MALLTLCLAVLVAQLDTAIANLAVRPIGTYFQADVDELQWVIDSYNLVYAAALLSGGLLADLYGRRRVFVLGAALFGVASIVCGAAPSVGMLIAARAAAGLGAALLIPASLAIIRVVWPDPAERGRALGIWAACTGVALAIGPTLGGLLIRAAGWRSVFFVVVPVAAAGALLARRSLPETAEPEGRSFDASAQAAGAGALGALAFAAISAKRQPFLAAAMAVVAAVLCAIFVLIESRRGAAALVPLDMFRSRPFSGAMAATTGMTFGMYGVLFLVPMVWQATGRLSAVATGLALMPMAAVYVVTSPWSGWLARRITDRGANAGGVALIGVGLLTIAFGAQAASLLPAEMGLALTGLGMGVATGPLMGVAVGAVGSERAGTASSLINVARMAGATVGVAILGAVFSFMGQGVAGLAVAMVFGGAVQLAGAATAWFAGPHQAVGSA